MERRVVIAEDDPVSAEFLRNALSPLGRVDSVANAAALDAALAGTPCDLLVLDDRLGETRADQLLGHLRSHHENLPILLVSADLPEELERARRRQGADACLAKPMSVDVLWRTLALIAPALLPIWDESGAERALGTDRTARKALRGLLVADLPGTRQRVADAVGQGNHALLGQELHRLRASCGFCGAAGLSAAVEALAARPAPDTLQAFGSACDMLIALGPPD